MDRRQKTDSQSNRGDPEAVDGARFEGDKTDRIDGVVELDPSVRIGQVPLMAKPASMTAARNVSQPVLVVPSPTLLSVCLKA